MQHCSIIINILLRKVCQKTNRIKIWRLKERSILKALRNKERYVLPEYLEWNSETVSKTLKGKKEYYKN